jgi:hypothetical protein
LFRLSRHEHGNMEGAVICHMPSLNTGQSWPRPC